MKKILLFALSIFSFAYSQELKLDRPPRDVGKYYPPNSNKFELLNSMHTMSTAFTGIFTNIQENDWKNAEKWSKVLRDNYLNVGKMVSDFDKNLKKDEVNMLLKAVEGRDLNNVKKYADAVGKSCSQCHQKYKITTRIMYHYPSFDVINIEDPVTRNSVEFGDFMKKMTDSMKKIKIYFEDGKVQKAQTEGNNFIKRFKAVADSCSECHTNKLSQQIYYGKDIEDRMNALSQAINSKNKDETYKILSYISE